MKRKFILAASFAMGCAGSAAADVWVERMLQDKKHDFGVVERGADAVHRFPIKNIYKHDIELVGVRSSCGCTAALLEKTSLQPGDVGYAVADLNTRTYTGPHDATLTIEVAWKDNGVRRLGEAAVSVRGVIRGNVIVEPDTVEFDNVEHGSTYEQRVRISAEGSMNWRLKEILCDCDNLEVDLSEATRTPGRVNYEMLVRLKPHAPPGFLREQLLLVTDDNLTPRIPLHVCGRVVQSLSVSPENLLFGRIALGERTARKVVVRGNEPFRILSAKSDSDVFHCRIASERSKRHILEVVFQPTREIGELNDTIRVVTDLEDKGAATFAAHARVVPLNPSE